MSQKVRRNMERSLGEMAFWHDELWSLYLHDICTTNHCRKLSWRGWLPALSNTYRNLPFLPAASRNPGHAGRCHGAGWLPAPSNMYRNLPFLPAANRTPGHKTTVMSPSLSRWWIIIGSLCWCRILFPDCYNRRWWSFAQDCQALEFLVTVVLFSLNGNYIKNLNLHVICYLFKPFIAFWE